MPHVEPCQRSQAQRKATDAGTPEPVDGGHEAGLDGAWRSARVAPHQIEHPAAVRAGRPEDDECDGDTGDLSDGDDRVVQSIGIEATDGEADRRAVPAA